MVWHNEKVIGGSRYCGKTTELVKTSSETGYPIVCACERDKRLVMDKAMELKLEIPQPVIVSDLPLRGAGFDYVLVDDVELVLSEIINVPVMTMSTSGELKRLGVMKEVVSDNMSMLQKKISNSAATLKSKVSEVSSTIYGLFKDSEEE